MKDLYKYYLFNKHVLVNDTPKQEFDPPFATLVTLGRKFGIRIKENPELANESMIHDAADYLGEYVPEPFYRGFPNTVREMSPNQLLFDQLYHYTQTYGCGWFNDPGHSIFEGKEAEIERVIYNEDIPPKEFRILPEEEAIEFLKSCMMDLLGSNRPLNAFQVNLIELGWKDFSTDILPEHIPCKDTAIFLLYQFKDLSFCRYLKLSDVIKLVHYIQWTQYRSENLKKLNLKNQDRKLITNVINELIRLDLASENKEYCDYTECFEKRRLWCGLFHHLHYKPPKENGLMGRFIDDVRNNRNFSVYKTFEEHMAKGNYSLAAGALARRKSKSELIRHLNYILSRCQTDAEIEEVFKWLE